jgi:hypothetical protein
MPFRDPLALRILTVISLAVGLPVPSAAQSAATRSSSPKWTVVVHVGVDATTNPRGGTATALPAAASVPILSIPPGPGGPVIADTRAVSSWYLGEGASLYNELRSVVGSLISAITPLDSALGRTGAARQSGGVFGARVSRRLTERFAAEFSLDVNTGTLALEAPLLAAIERSRASFQNAFNRLFANQLTQSQATIVDRVGTRIFAGGAMTIDISRHGRLVSYATIGAGVETPRGDSPRATLAGSYQFTSATGTLRETDTVTVRVETVRAAVALVGGGFKWDIGRRSGLRVDVRLPAGPQSSRLLLDARPGSNNSGTATGLLFSSPTTPTVIFSTSVLPTSLSGPALQGFEVFRGSGTGIHTALTAGYSLRF